MFPLVVVAGMGAFWLWDRWWGQGLLIGAAAVVLALIIFRICLIPQFRRERREQAEKQRRRLATVQGLLELTPSDFEYQVAYLLKASGYTNVRVNGGAGDLQADITCRDRQSRATIVQCKRYALDKRIGSPVVQSFIGMAKVHHRSVRSIIATTTTFTHPAIRLASVHGIELWDGSSLANRFHDLARRNSTEQP